MNLLLHEHAPTLLMMLPDQSPDFPLDLRSAFLPATQQEDPAENSASPSLQVLPVGMILFLFAKCVFFQCTLIIPHCKREGGFPLCIRVTHVF